MTTKIDTNKRTNRLIEIVVMMKEGEDLGGFHNQARK